MLCVGVNASNGTLVSALSFHFHLQDYVNDYYDLAQLSVNGAHWLGLALEYQMSILIFFGISPLFLTPNSWLIPPTRNFKPHALFR